MSDRQRQLQQTRVKTLTGPILLEHDLPGHVIASFAAMKRRRELLRSEVFRRHEQEVLDLTYALLHRPAAPPPPAPRRDFVRVVSWNIQRGIFLDKIMKYFDRHPVLQHADILMLNEVDIGMSRSGNRDVAAELASHLGFSHVYGNSYLCLDFGDPRDSGSHRGAVMDDNRESMHGNAILSRYPIRRAENFSIEISKDKFHSSERRLGHKKSLWAEVETPLGPLPVVSVHLDSFATSAQRGAQLQDVLDKIEQRGLRRVLLGGDLNTTTYDAGTVGQLCFNLVKKLFRGGFPHALHHYLHPQDLYERPVFDCLDAGGFDYRGFNAMKEGTMRYEVGSYESESKVSELLPDVAVQVLRHKLKPWGGVAALKVDWFAGRGLQVAHGAGGAGDGAASPRSPTSFARPEVDGTSLSDHDPILVDVRF